MPNEVPYILERLRKYWNPCLMVMKQSIKFLNKSTYTRNLHVWLGFRFSSKFLFLNTSLAQIEIELRSCIASKKLLQALADNTQQSIHVGFIVIKVFRITKSHLFLPGVVISSAMRWSRKIRWLVSWFVRSLPFLGEYKSEVHEMWHRCYLCRILLLTFETSR